MNRKDAKKRHNELGFDFQQVDYVEMCVGNAFQAAHFYRTVLGFDIVAYKDLTTGSRDKVSYLVKQGEIYLVLSSGIEDSSPLSHHLHVHGEGVIDIAFTVPDATDAFKMSVDATAVPVHEPKVFDDEQGQATIAAIGTFGETIHSLVERKGGSGSFFLPGFKPYTYLAEKSPGTGLTKLDHIAISVEHENLKKWAAFYMEKLGFYTGFKTPLETNISGMDSHCVRLVPESIKLPFVAPLPGKRKSQIAEYLSYYKGEGVQHLAFLTDNIVGSVRALRNHGIEFLYTPATYYDGLLEEKGPIEENFEDLKELGILLDRDADGYLLQNFSRPIQSRPTYFLEFIQRNGSDGFGVGNITALFKSIEREQEMRGNL
ncbi:MAG: 4-hydroxyphenylpyruvate dioxygenase [bacterium]|nr:4-hydroxyphenylpyruvate dioxygenase [bacterium]